MIMQLFNNMQWNIFPSVRDGTFLSLHFESKGLILIFRVKLKHLNILVNEISVDRGTTLILLYICKLSIRRRVVNEC